MASGSQIQSPTIGVVTALPKEFASFELMLDEAKDVVIEGDPGRYVIGRIGGHSVVLALLPKMGLDPATAVASHLLRSFPGVGDILMVGIAGGVPNPKIPENHVRLGDVVVSSGTGVTQFDAGKIEQVTEGGRAVGTLFKVRQSSPPPSARFSQEVRILHARRLRGERPWEGFIGRAAQLEHSARPGDSQDVLHDSEEPECTIQHPMDPDRRPGQPRIHEGVIASSNALLKDPRMRDHLREEYDARAVEMEGSGIATATWIAGRAGYLLVRGICDYCDKHKNDVWQGYAAVAAAAYARALLLSLPAAHALSEKSPEFAQLRRRLRDALVKHFNREELEFLCGDVQDDLAAAGIHLRLSLDMVGGEGHESRCYNLITYLERRGYRVYLERAVMRARPQVNLYS